MLLYLSTLTSSPPTAPSCPLLPPLVDIWLILYDVGVLKVISECIQCNKVTIFTILIRKIDKKRGGFESDSALSDVAHHFYGFILVQLFGAEIEPP